MSKDEERQTEESVESTGAGPATRQERLRQVAEAAAAIGMTCISAALTGFFMQAGAATYSRMRK